MCGQSPFNSLRLYSMSYSGYKKLLEQDPDFEDRAEAVSVDQGGLKPPERLVACLIAHKVFDEWGTRPASLSLADCTAWVKECAGLQTASGRAPHQVVNSLLKAVGINAPLPGKAEVRAELRRWAASSTALAVALDELAGRLKAGTSLVLLSYMGEANGNDEEYGWRWLVRERLQAVAVAVLGQEIGLDFDGRPALVGQQATIGASVMSKLTQAARLRTEDDLPPSVEDLVELEDLFGESPSWARQAARAWNADYCSVTTA
jgi:hypothetical protein